MPLAQANNLRQQSLTGSGEMTAFASRLLQFAGIDAGAAAPVERGYSSSPEIFAMSENLSRWPHAASTRTTNSKLEFFQDEDHETDK